MMSARVRKTSSSLAWYFSQIALTDSASMRACAGSYTPHGRSQCARTTVEGAGRLLSVRRSGGSGIGGAVLPCGGPMGRLLMALILDTTCGPEAGAAREPPPVGRSAGCWYGAR